MEQTVRPNERQQAFCLGLNAALVGTGANTSVLRWDAITIQNNGQGVAGPPIANWMLFATGAVPGSTFTLLRRGIYRFQGSAVIPATSPVRFAVSMNASAAVLAFAGSLLPSVDATVRDSASVTAPAATIVSARVDYIMVVSDADAAAGAVVRYHLQTVAAPNTIIVDANVDQADVQAIVTYLGDIYGA